MNIVLIKISNKFYFFKGDLLSGSITWECAQYFKKWQDNLSKKILTLGKVIENEIKEEEKYVDEFMEHRIDDDNESETKEAQKYNDEIVEHSINDNVPVKIKFTVVGEKRRGPKKSELADPNAIFFPDPDNPTQYFCKICKFKVKRSEIFSEKYRNHRLSRHMTSKIWKYFAFDPINQKFCTCALCGNNIEVITNGKRLKTYGNILKRHLISNHQIHLKNAPRLKEKILDADTGLMKPLPGRMNVPKLKARNEGKRKEYWQHFNSLDDPYKLSCKVCSKIIVCGRKSHQPYNEMYKHLKEHDISLEKKYSCTYCGKCFDRSKLLNSHVSQHEKKFICKFCGRGFGSKIKQEDHENTHTGAKPHICKTCGISYAQRSNLIMHMKKH